MLTCCDAAARALCHQSLSSVRLRQSGAISDLKCTRRKLPGDLKALCGNKTVVEAVLRSMQEEGRVSKLKGFEQVWSSAFSAGQAACCAALLCKLMVCVLTQLALAQVAAVHLCHEPWSIENGLLTPTMKLKRPTAQKQFQPVLDGLYKLLK